MKCVSSIALPFYFSAQGSDRCSLQGIDASYNIWVKGDIVCDSLCT